MTWCDVAVATRVRKYTRPAFRPLPPTLAAAAAASTIPSWLALLSRSRCLSPSGRCRVRSPLSEPVSWRRPARSGCSSGCVAARPLDRGRNIRRHLHRRALAGGRAPCRRAGPRPLGHLRPRGGASLFSSHRERGQTTRRLQRWGTPSLASRLRRMQGETLQHRLSLQAAAPGRHMHALLALEPSTVMGIRHYVSATPAEHLAQP